MLAKRRLPTHPVLQEEQLSEIDLRSCSATTALSYLCLANLNLRDGCLTNASMCSTVVKRFSGTEWMTNSFGYLLASDQDCIYKLGKKGTNMVLQKGHFHYIAFNSTAAIFCQPDVLIAAEPREFEFGYHYKENWNVSELKKEWSYAPTDWADEAQLIDLHESTKSRKLVWDRLAEDSSSLALFISIGGALVSMLFSIGTCLLVFDRRPVRRAAAPVVVENKVQTPQSIPTVPTIVVVHSEQPQPPLYPALPIVTSIAPRVLGTMNSPPSSKLESGGLDF